MAKSPRKNKHRGMKGLVALLVIVAVLAGGSAVALAVDDGMRTRVVPDRTVLDGAVDVSGMTAEQLEQTIEARAKNGFAAKANLVLDGKTYSIDLAKAGGVDTEPTVAKAFEPYDKGTLQRYGDRVVSLVTGKEETRQISTVLAPSAKKLKTLVKDIAKRVDTPAVSASYECTDAGLVTSEAKTGKKVDVNATVEALRRALASTGEASVTAKGVVEKVKPGSREAGQAIYVDTGACEVYLYENGDVRASYPCTPGKAGYETPRGDWTLEYKDPAPVWQNPHSDWSQDMPETIDPGENNPLGLRALAVSCGGGIFIHGTTNTGQLGSPGSHGCVRLANADIVSLYDMVSAGIPIFIR